MSVVLLVEDDKLLRRTLRASLRSWNFEVLEADSGEEALTLVTNGGPDLVLLDLSLPGIDGIETLRHLRSFTNVPVLVLTVRDALADKVTALESGADDYMVKPFEPEELLARTRAHLRRAHAVEPQPAVVRSGPLEIDLARSLVTWDGEPIALTPTELRLLEVLLANRGKLVTREKLLETVWGSRQRSDLGRLRVFVLHLRRKLHDDAARPRLIFTEPGLGYRWIATHEEEDLDSTPERVCSDSCQA
jgi:two-component system KDP operon response regulator KdpE